MKTIIHFNTVDFGGAASAAYRFHKNLQNSFQNSYFFVSLKTKNDQSVILLKSNFLRTFFYKNLNKIEAKLGFFNPKYYFFDKDRSYKYNIIKVLERNNIKPDVIVLHWISNFIEFAEILDIVKQYKCKVYWYLMDMAPITGGCHFAWDCQGFLSSCEKCPAVPFYMIGQPNKILIKKSSFVEYANVVALSGSSYLSKQLKCSTIFKNSRIVELMLGINPNVFRPLDSVGLLSLKCNWGIPIDKRIVFVGATNIKEERKGFNYVLESFKLFKQLSPLLSKKLFVLVAGKSDSADFLDVIGFEGKYIGYLEGDFELAKAYQISDFFISGSIEDSGPMMINESIMTGTPVVSFRMGIAEDLIIPGQTGFLATLKNSEDMANCIYEFMNKSDEEINYMKKLCRDLALNRTSVEVQINKFLEETDYL